MEKGHPRPTGQYTIQQYQAVRPLAKLMGLFNKDLRAKFAALEEQFESMNLMLRNRDIFATIYGPLGWVTYDRLSTEIMARVVAMPVQEGETALTQYHLDPKNLRFLGYRFNALHYMAWGDIYERAVERVGAQDFLSSIPLVLIVIDGICTTMSGKHPFSGGADAPVFDSETSRPGGLADGFAILGSTRRKLDVEVIEAPFRHGIVHGLNPNYGQPLVAAKAFNLLQATVDYFDRRRDEAERLAAAEENQKPADIRELGRRLRRNAEIKRALDAWQARPPVSGEQIAATGETGALVPGTPEAFAAGYLDLLMARNYGGLAKATVDYPKRSISCRAGLLREELNDVTITEWAITGVEDTAPAMSRVNATIKGTIDGEVWTGEQCVRLLFADEDYRAVVRGQPDGNWTAMPDFLSNLHVMVVRARRAEIA